MAAQVQHLLTLGIQLQSYKELPESPSSMLWFLNCQRDLTQMFDSVYIDAWKKMLSLDCRGSRKISEENVSEKSLNWHVDFI